MLYYIAMSMFSVIVIAGLDFIFKQTIKFNSNNTHNYHFVLGHITSKYRKNYHMKLQKIS